MLCNTCWDPSSAAVAVARAAITLSGTAAGTGPLLNWSASGEEGSAVWARNAAGSLVGTEVGLRVNRGLSPLSGPSLLSSLVFSSNTRTLLEKTSRGSVAGRAGQTHLSLSSRAWTNIKQKDRHTNTLSKTKQDQLGLVKTLCTN